jgi:SH3-like domain-containing protein
MIKFYRPLVFVILSLTSVTSMGKGACTYQEKTPLRGGPSNSSELLWEVPQLTPLKILNQKGHWYQVQDSEKISFWVEKKYVRKDFFCGSVKTERTLRRKGPSEKSQAKKSPSHFYFDSNLKILEFKGIWAKVQNPSGGEVAWVKRKHLWVQ